MNEYNINLTKEQEERAERLHKNSVIADMLFQGPIGTYSIDEETEQELLELATKACPNDPVAQIDYAQNLINSWMLNGKLSDLYENCWMESGINLSCRQLSISSKDALMRSIVDVQEEFDRKPWIVKCRNAEEIKTAIKSGKKACVVLSQEALGYGKDLSLLEMAYRFGLRIQQLTYNNHNLIGAGCMEPNDAGLSLFGMKFVEKCNELGILVDTGHCGKQTTLDACRLSKSPVVASHTGVDRIYHHNRCKSEEEIKAIAATGGVLGMFAMPWFIAKDPKQTTIDDLIAHMEAVIDLVGIDHVGIGTDWPMPQTKWMAVAFKEYLAVKVFGFQPGDGPSTEVVHGLTDYRGFINITRGLVAKGYSDEDIQKIMGGNWLRVIAQVCH
ncbi:MAG: membrane dipeptidase [Lachnospiraceae bacterium]